VQDNELEQLWCRSKDHFELFDPSKLDGLPTSRELVAAVSAVTAYWDSGAIVRPAHVRHAHALIQRTQLYLGFQLLESTHALLKRLIETAVPPPRWSSVSRKMLEQLSPTLPPSDADQTMSRRHCAWGDPGHVSLSSSLRHVASDRRKLARFLGWTAQGLAIKDDCGLVLPVHIIELSQALIDLPMPVDAQLRSGIRAARRDYRQNTPGLRFHRLAWRALSTLVDRLVAANSQRAGLRDRVMALRAGALGARSGSVRTASPSFPGLPLGWAGETVARADSARAASPLIHRGEGHLITIAPTGTGKGVGSVIPALLSHEGSAIVIDPKGENYAVTANFRRALGQQVCVLDPFGVTGAVSDRLNPLERFFQNSVSRLEPAKKIVELLAAIPPDMGSNAWWYHRRVEILTSGLILASLDEKRLRSGLRGWLELYAAKDGELDQLIKRGNASTDIEVRIAAEAFQAGGTESRQSALMGVTSALSVLLEEPVLDGFRGPSTVSLRDLRDGVPMTIYLVLPPALLTTHGALLRLWLGLMLEAVLDRKVIPEHQTLFLVDEAAQLGRMEQLLTAITLARGYGLSTWTFWQDLGQIQRLYAAEWRTIINNCSVHQHFGVPYFPEAERIARLYPGVEPNDLMALGPGKQLLVRRGERPVVSRRVNYLRDAAFKGQFSANPFHAPRVQEMGAQVHYLSR